MENKKKKSGILKDTLALLLITLISGLALSFVYEITKAPIAAQEVAKTEAAYQKAYPEAATFEEDGALMQKLSETDLTSLSPDYKGITINKINKAYDSSKNMIGYLITVSSKKGYNKSKPIQFALAIDKTGAIKGIDFISLSETVGLGMKAAEPKFKDQFNGKKAAAFEVVKTGAASDNQIDAISGATITSKAVTFGVNAAVSFVSQNGELGGGADE